MDFIQVFFNYIPIVVDEFGPKSFVSRYGLAMKYFRDEAYSVGLLF
jgi:hypothetical protein